MLHLLPLLPPLRPLPLLPRPLPPPLPMLSAKLPPSLVLQRRRRLMACATPVPLLPLTWLLPTLPPLPPAPALLDDRDGAGFEASCTSSCSLEESTVKSKT